MPSKPPRLNRRRDEMIYLRDQVLEVMRTEKHEKVLEKLATSDKATIIIERQTELKCALRQALG